MIIHYLMYRKTYADHRSSEFSSEEDCVMPGRLRFTLAATAAAGVVVLGTGTAYAEGLGSGTGYAASSHQGDSADECSRKFDEHQKPLGEADFPSDHSAEADSNSTTKDTRDASGDPYYTHSRACDSEPRDKDRHDDSYDTFKYNKHQNTYDSLRGWDPKRYDYDKYDVNRCLHDQLGSGKSSSDTDDDDHSEGDGGRGKDCQHHSADVNEDDDRYNPDPHEYNTDN
jgi:hypothetical protein